MSTQRWKKMAAAAAPPVRIFHSCANFCFFVTHFVLKNCLFCAIFGIFANFARFWKKKIHIFCVLIFQTGSFVCAIL